MASQLGTLDPSFILKANPFIWRRLELRSSCFGRIVVDAERVVTRRSNDTASLAPATAAGQSLPVAMILPSSITISQSKRSASPIYLSSGVNFN
jgi:hypothetical protein